MFQTCVHAALEWRDEASHNHCVPCAPRGSVTMRRELRDKVMNWALLKHTIAETRCCDKLIPFPLKFEQSFNNICQTIIHDAY